METATFNGIEYEFKKYGLNEVRQIRNKSIKINTTSGERSIEFGELEYWTVLFSLESGLKNEKQEAVETTKENFDKYFPCEFLDDAFIIAQKINNLSADQKNE